jgi:hypothetical protein
MRQAKMEKSIKYSSLLAMARGYTMLKKERLALTNGRYGDSLLVVSKLLILFAAPLVKTGRRRPNDLA